MDNLQFGEQNNYSFQNSGPKGFTAWLISKGIAKSEGQAAMILYTIAGVIILIVIIMFVTGGSRPSTTTEDPALSSGDEI